MQSWLSAHLLVPSPSHILPCTQNSINLQSGSNVLREGGSTPCWINHHFPKAFMEDPQLFANDWFSRGPAMQLEKEMNKYARKGVLGKFSMIRRCSSEDTLNPLSCLCMQLVGMWFLKLRQLFCSLKWTTLSVNSDVFRANKKMRERACFLMPSLCCSFSNTRAAYFRHLVTGEDKFLF